MSYRKRSPYKNPHEKSPFIKIKSSPHFSPTPILKRVSAKDLTDEGIDIKPISEFSVKTLKKMIKNINPNIAVYKYNKKTLINIIKKQFGITYAYADF